MCRHHVFDGLCTHPGYPCLCLKRGFFLLITYNTPFRRTILQSALRFLMDALTFITCFFAAGFAFAYLYLKMILPLDRSYGLISTPTLSPGSILM